MPLACVQNKDSQIIGNTESRHVDQIIEQRFRRRDAAEPLCLNKHAQQPNDFQVQFFSDPLSAEFIDQEIVGVEFLCQNDGLAFPGAQFLSQPGDGSIIPGRRTSTDFRNWGMVASVSR